MLLLAYALHVVAKINVHNFFILLVQKLSIFLNFEIGPTSKIKLPMKISRIRHILPLSFVYT